MKIEQFEDLLVWQKAQDLAVFIYGLLYGNKDQPTTPNYIRYLHIARTSNSEVRSMSYLTLRLKYCDADAQKYVRSECTAISKTLWSMTEKLEAKIKGVVHADHHRTKHPQIPEPVRGYTNNEVRCASSTRATTPDPLDHNE